LKRVILIKTLLPLLLIGTRLFCQDQSLKTGQHSWDHAPVRYGEINVSPGFKNDHLVIIKEQADFDFTDYSTKTLRKTVLIKIMDEEGLKAFSSVSLPETFDVADNTELWQQGRLSRTKIPSIQYYEIDYFIARITRPNGKVIYLKPEQSSSKVRWIVPDGNLKDDYITTYSFDNLEAGDLLEYSYKVYYRPSYGSDMIYLSSKLSKENVEYNFKYISIPQLKNYKFILTSNIPDSCITYEHEEISKDLTYIRGKINLTNVQRVNYFIHALSAKQLPVVYFNFNYTIKLVNNKSFSVADLPDFRWAQIQPSQSANTRYYTKFPNGIRKFIKTIPALEDDSMHSKFLRAICDTLNSFKYYSSNYMLYNAPRLYSVYSVDHLFKRRICEFNMLKVYQSILDEKNIFYYITNIQDKRLGEHNPFTRNRAYENIILSIPAKNFYRYFVPRYNGLKYFPDELPFYFEGAVAVLFPATYTNKKGKTVSTLFKFIKTHQGTYDQNSRIENCRVSVNTDSLKASLLIEESLSGQFSTIIRPLYLKDDIDSTVNVIYFKKCVDKPGSANHKLILNSKSDLYPFKFEFHASEDVSFKERGEIDLKNWFSFLFNKKLIPEKPTHDFYFDFLFSDSYNFNFVFDTLVTLVNVEEFRRTIDNDYFELDSKIEKQENSFLASVTVKVKKNMLPKEEGIRLIEFIDGLESINNFKIRYKK
jgi:hypothetical protein